MITTRSVVKMNSTLTDPGSYEVTTVELDEPRQGEITVRVKAAGLCHSDDHIARGEVIAGTYPFVLGHEGAGVVEVVGPNTPGYSVGDRVVFSFIPNCGRCRWCANGMQSLCDRGALGMHGSRFDDPDDYRVHLADGRGVGQLMGIGSFSELTTVDVTSAVRVDADIPFSSLALFSCAVGTGFGSAVNGAEVKPGHTVVVMGVGGIGIHAVQGARYAGAAHIVAVDPVAMKQGVALKLGATAAFNSLADAREHVLDLTNGQGADSVIVCVGVPRGGDIAEAFSLIRKAGTVMVTGLASTDEIGIPVSPFELTVMQKRIQGGVFGMCNPTWDILGQIEMYQSGGLHVDELVTQTYTLDTIADGYADLLAGRNMRGVVTL